METLHCPSCGAGFESNEKYCSYCGMQIIRDKSKMGPALRAREYRQNGRYIDALVAYNEWLMDEPKNDAVWLEYMEVLLEISSKQSYKNINTVLEANSMMLKYCSTMSLFGTFSNPERVIALVEQISSAGKGIPQGMGFEPNISDEIDLCRLIDKIPKMIFEDTGNIENNDAMEIFNDVMNDEDIKQAMDGFGNFDNFFNNFNASNVQMNSSSTTIVNGKVVSKTSSNEPMFPFTNIMEQSDSGTFNPALFHRFQFLAAHFLTDSDAEKCLDFKVTEN